MSRHDLAAARHLQPVSWRPAAARRTAPLALAALAFAGTAARAADPAPADRTAADGFSAGVEVRRIDTAADIGLPAYPGATPWREPGDDGAGASLGLWGGAFGIRLRVLKLHSADGVDAVARYYRDALVRQGRLLDCSAGDATPTLPPPRPDAAAARDSVLTCGNDRAQAGSFLFKSGVPGDVRMVSIVAAATGTRVQLVRLQLRGD